VANGDKFPEWKSGNEFNRVKGSRLTRSGDQMR